MRVIFIMLPLILVSCESLTRDVSGTLRPDLPHITSSLKTPCERPERLPDGSTVADVIRDNKDVTGKLNACADRHGALVNEIDIVYEDN